MPVTLTIKQVPDAVAARLRQRAEGNRRSLQRELLLIVETAAQDASAGIRAGEPSAPAYTVQPTAGSGGDGKKRKGGKREIRDGRLSLAELWQRARALGAGMDAESTGIVRADRDARRN